MAPSRLVVLLLLLAGLAPSRGMAQDSVTVLLDLAPGTYGTVGRQRVEARVGLTPPSLSQIKVVKGRPLAYSFGSRPGWTAPVLELVGHGIVPADSTLVPRGPLILVVVAHRIPTLVPQARRWHDLNLQALRSPTPGPIYEEILCETGRLMDVLGVDSATLVTGWAEEIAIREVTDTHAVARLDSLLGGQLYEIKCARPASQSRPNNRPAD